MTILPTLILMLGVIGIISFLGQRVAIPAPVLFALAGVVGSLIPSLPSPEIANPMRSETIMSRSGLSWSSAIAK